jgi:phospholipid/cholesterol/gamma-HCH transport system substrate-binding protein
VPALLVAVAALAGCGGHGQRVVAEFTSARGLVENADVRVGGAVAGRVSGIELTDAGRARVTMELHDGLGAVRRDAVAAIRPVDLLGDVYVDLSPGHDPEPLRGVLGVGRSSNAPRLDELLASFDGPVRTGLQALLVEGGRALEGRGDDVARAAVELRPALRASDGVLRELGAQNAALGRLVADAERTTSRLAREPRDVQGTVDGLARTLRATARRGPQLDRALRGLPATLRRVGATARALDATAGAAVPLASDVRAAAPGLAGALGELPPFLRALRAASGDLRPTLRALRATLVGGAPALAGLDSGLGALDGISAPLDRLLAAGQAAAPAISEGFFVNFADQGAEPGRQPFDPFADPRRDYWRGAAVMSCEAFGVKVAPGCLAKVLGPRPKGSDPSVLDPSGVRPPGVTPQGVRPPGVTPPKPALGHALDFLLKP